MCAVAYAIVAVLAHFYDRFPGDEPLTDAFQAVDIPALGGYLTFMNLVGNGWVQGGLIAALVGMLAVASRGWEALLVLYTAVPSLFDNAVKEWVGRPRPSEQLVDVSDAASGFSFPSGHVVNTGTLFLVLLVIAPAFVSNRIARAVLQGACLLMIVSTGPARVYVGVHWPSDVLGGYALVALMVVPLLLVYLLGRRAQPRGQ